LLFGGFAWSLSGEIEQEAMFVAKERLFVLKMEVERTRGDARCTRDLVARDAVEPVLREKIRGRIDQAAAGLGATARRGGPGLGTDVHVRE